MTTSSHGEARWPMVQPVAGRGPAAERRKPRPLFGNQLRWAKRVIEDAIAQRRAAKVS